MIEVFHNTLLIFPRITVNGDATVSKTDESDSLLDLEQSILSECLMNNSVVVYGNAA